MLRASLLDRHVYHRILWRAIFFRIYYHFCDLAKMEQILSVNIYWFCRNLTRFNKGNQIYIDRRQLWLKNILDQVLPLEVDGKGKDHSVGVITVGAKTLYLLSMLGVAAKSTWTQARKISTGLELYSWFICQWNLLIFTEKCTFGKLETHVETE